MNIPVYNKSGKKVRDIEVGKDISEITVKQDLLLQIVDAMLSERRESNAHTKTRAERRGGGKKPWKQKGTGRARHGSSRSPIWRKGGVTFGPRNERNFTKKVNKKVRQKGLQMAIASKLQEDKVLAFEGLELKQPKTKELAAYMKALPSGTEKALIVMNEPNDTIKKSEKNITHTRLIDFRNMNVLDVMTSSYIIFEEGAAEKLSASQAKS
jgi:large subunit ribosomal protein L4